MLLQTLHEFISSVISHRLFFNMGNYQQSSKYLQQKKLTQVCIILEWVNYYFH